MVGGFGSAFQSGKDQKQKAEDAAAREKQKQIDDAQALRDKGMAWIERVIRPIIPGANEELKPHQILLELEVTSLTYSSAKIKISSQRPPRAKAAGYVSFNVLEGGVVKSYIDGNEPKELGTTETTTSHEVGEILKEKLRRLGSSGS